MDGFIDDIIAITIDEPCWVERAKNTALLVIHTIFRLLHPYESLKQDVPPLTPQYCGRSSALQTKDLSELGNPDPLYMGIPAKVKRDTLSKRNQRIPRLN